MTPKLLLVLSPERRSRILPLFDGEKWEIERASGYQDGVRRLSEGKSYDLIVADAELPDGSWRNLMLFVQNAGRVCEMVICSRHGDQQLWAEVIQCGAYDLLTEPLERQEVSRILRSALESGYMRRFAGAKALPLNTPV